MSRRDRDAPQDVGAPLAEWPAIVLVRPQLGENVGAAARAMLNCGLTDLRLVEPRSAWPNEKARAMATGAVGVVDEAAEYDDVEGAIADLHHVYATTARDRDMLKEVVTPEAAAREIVAHSARGERSGVLFGPERTGLDNDHVAIASKLLHIPLNPGFSSLNLAQAVLLVCYTCHTESLRPRGAQRPEPADPLEAAAPSEWAGESMTPAATSEQLVNFFEHLERELDATRFLRIREKRDIMRRNLRNLFQRAHLREHEVNTLHGIVSSLVGHRKDGEPVRRPRAERETETDEGA